MTSVEQRVCAVRARSEVEVLLDQVRGVDVWSREHRSADLQLEAAMSREMRLDLARRRDVVERQRAALIDWTTRQLDGTGHLMRSTALPRAVVVHRHEWFKGKVAAGLAVEGISVVASLENGADAVGVVVAEQPDLVLLEDKLPMVTGLDLTRAVRRYAPSAMVIAQVVQDGEIAPFLEAGATAAHTRRVPPADIALAMRLLLADACPRSPCPADLSASPA